MRNILARFYGRLSAGKRARVAEDGAIRRRSVPEGMDAFDCMDELTGVGNRFACMAKLEALGRGKPCALGVIDVDINGLRMINERFGHRYGDRVLREAARLLRRYAGEQVYRTGEDEFTVLCCGADKTAFDAICASVHQAFAKTEAYTATVGCTWWEKEMELDHLLARIRGVMEAEKAMYYHDAGYDQSVMKHGDAAAELLREIADGRFRVYFQPQVDMQSGQVIGAEALLRKVDEAGNIIPPGEFIPMYEALGIQTHLDMYVLETVVDMLACLQAEGRALTISLNISRPTLYMPDLVRRIERMLERRQVNPGYLKLEFTESVAKDGMEILACVVKALRKTGIAAALDDFGTQYANLSVIMDIGFDEIKLDKSLIDHVCTERRNQIVLQSVIDMCRRLDNRRIVAEGVERPEQSEKLQSMSCRYGQGYLYYKPMPMDEFIRMNEGKGHADSTTHAD